MAKKFFYVCAGVLMLAGAYAIGANNVVAQVGDQTVVAVTQTGYYSTIQVITAAGDVYKSDNDGGNFVFQENVFGGVVSSESSGLGDMKSQYR